MEGVEAHPRKHRFREGGRQDNGKWRPVALTGAKRRKSVVELTILSITNTKECC